jgi:hypothetical protein
MSLKILIVSAGWMLFAVVVGPGTTRAQIEDRPFPTVADVVVKQPQVEVPQWQPHDFGFASKTPPDNPFAAGFSATVTQPDGKTWTTHGFYDGHNVWKVRVAPQAVGPWSLVTHSDVKDLDGKRATFTCVENTNRRVHGGLRVDADYPRHFRFDDGTRFFLLGYECDWLWALDLQQPDLKNTTALLDKLTSFGFNYIILNAYAHDTAWRKGRTAEDDYGPPAVYAWEGTNDQPDHSRFNLAYWQHYDRVLRALYERGIVAHIMIKVYNKMVHWPDRGSAEDDQYFRWLVARYAAFPNVVWDFSKEAHNERLLSYKLTRLRLLRDLDPYRRPITVHDDNAAYDQGAYDELLDFRSDQQHSNWHQTILAQRKQHDWPVVNVEFGYEHGPGGADDKTYGVVQPPEEVCRRAWEICLAGGYTVYYYTNTAWDVIRPRENPTGYAYFKYLRDFFEQASYWRMQPSDDLVSNGYCLADPGREYIVYLNRTQPFTLKLAQLQQPLAGQWYQPLTGNRASAGHLNNGLAELSPPADWGDGPIALYIGPLIKSEAK